MGLKQHIAGSPNFWIGSWLEEGCPHIYIYIYIIHICIYMYILKHHPTPLHPEHQAVSQDSVGLPAVRSGRLRQPQVSQTPGVFWFWDDGQGRSRFIWLFVLFRFGVALNMKSYSPPTLQIKALMSESTNVGGFGKCFFSLQAGTSSAFVVSLLAKQINWRSIFQKLNLLQENGSLAGPQSVGEVAVGEISLATSFFKPVCCVDVCGVPCKEMPSNQVFSQVFVESCQVGG